MKKSYDDALKDLKSIENKWLYDEGRESETITLKFNQESMDSINAAIKALSAAKQMPAFIYQLDQARQFVTTGRDSISYAKAEVLGNVIDQLKEIFPQE